MPCSASLSASAAASSTATTCRAAEAYASPSRASTFAPGFRSKLRVRRAGNQRLTQLSGDAELAVRLSG